MSDPAGATQTLARYVVDAQYAAIPARMRHEAKRALCWNAESLPDIGALARAAAAPVQ